VNDGDSSRDLLQELRIGREQRDEADSRRPVWPWMAGVVLVLLAAAGIAVYALRGRAAVVQTATAVAASAGDNAAVLQATGYVVARREATVSAQIIGTLTQVLVEEGEHVRKGQILARLEDTQYKAQLDASEAQYAAARAQVVQARAQSKQATDDAARMDAVEKKGLVSTQQAEQARTLAATDRALLSAAAKQAQAAASQVQAAKINYDYTIVRSPFDGVVTDKAAQVGEIVSPYSAGGGFTRTGIATVVDMDSLEVDVDVNETYIARVVPGMKAEAVLDAYPDWKIPAHVIAIIPSADRSKATVKVRVGLDVKDPRILPEMGVRVSFLEERKGNAQPIRGVLVPKDTIVKRDGRDVVFTLEGNHVRQTPVTVGADFSDMKQVTRGVRAGAEVVKAPPEDLKDGERVKVAAGGSG
jgi:RND family efflux transporter MFP subunit